MHLRNVEIFCDVAARRSFSKAADAHNVSQSSASQAVNLLEKRLGSQLIDRSKRPLELTPAGKVYFDGCRELLDSFRSIEDQVRQMSNQVAGRVRVAAIYSVGLLQMDSYVKRFFQLYPEVELQLDYLHPDAVYRSVINDEADLGLVSFPRDGGEISSIDWQEQEMVLVVPPAHRLAGRRSVPVRSLEGEDYVAFTTDLSIRRQVDRWLKRSKVHVQIVHEFDSIEHIKRAVEIGCGVAVLPAPTVRQENGIGTLISLRLERTKWHRPLGIVHRRHKTLSTAATKFVELLRSHAADLSSNGDDTHDSPARRNHSSSRPGRKKLRHVLPSAPVRRDK